MSLQEIGHIGESYAAEFLRNNGFIILDQNFRMRLGELDIVAKKSNKVYFCEVKTRVGDSHGKPYEAVTYRKLEHIKRVATAYVLQNELKNSKLSVQVISIILNLDLKIKEIQMYEII